MEAREIVEREKYLRGQRGTWESHWEEVARYMLPMREDIISVRTPGEKLHNRIFDNTAIHSLDMLAGAVHSLLTSPDIPFFELTSGDPDLDKDKEVAVWLDNAERVIFDTIMNSNYQTESYPMYLDLAGLGTAILAVEEDNEFDIRFSSKSLKFGVVEEDYRGIVNKFYCYFEWSAYQMADFFGMKNLPEEVTKCLEDSNKSVASSRKFKVVLGIYPLLTKDGRSKQAGFTFESKYVYCGPVSRANEFLVLKTGKFREFPYLVPRWMKASGEIYGRGPGMAALPTTKMLNKMKETMIKAGQKIVDPPLQVPDDGFIGPIVSRPAGLNYYRAGTSDRIEPFGNNGRVDFGFQLLEAERIQIRQTFFIDQLQLREGPQMTATEVLQRIEENSRLLRPMLGRLEFEFLRPLIDRVYSILVKRGKIDERSAPEKLKAVGGFKSRYSSTIARAAKAAEGQSAVRALELSAPFAQADPSVFNVINGKAAVRKIFDSLNVSKQLLRSEDEVRALEEQQAQERQQAQQMEQMQQEADLVQKAGKVAANQ